MYSGPSFRTVSSGYESFQDDGPLFNTEEKEQDEEPEERAHEEDMNYDPDGGDDDESPEGSLLDDVNSGEFAKQYAKMEEDKLNDHEENPKKPQSDVLPEDVSFETPKHNEEEPDYSTASESQQSNRGYRREATADSSYAEDQSDKSERVTKKQPDNWAEKASATRSAFFPAPTYASDDKMSYDIGPVLVDKTDYELSITNQMTTPRVCESLLEVKLLRANLQNKRLFQSQLTVKAMRVII